MLQQVDFYLLQANSRRNPLKVAVQLIEKAWNGGQSIYILCHNQQQVEQLDQLLWTFKADSFIPHGILNADNSSNESIVIGTEYQLPVSDVVLNLSNRQPENPQQCQRVLEVVAAEEESTIAARQRYRYYQKLDIKPNTHKL